MDRAAVGIVAGVGDQLVIRGQRQLLVERVGIVGFENPLAPVVQFRRSAGQRGRRRAIADLQLTEVVVQIRSRRD